MKKYLLLSSVILASQMFVLAQKPDPELDYIKNEYSKEKKTIVDEYMGLDVQQGAKFWTAYAEYEGKREKLAKERLKLIDDYANTTEITAQNADKIAKAVLMNSVNLAKLNLETYEKIKKAVGAVNAAKFMQLETFLQTAWRAVIQEHIPLIGELEKTAKD
jgi:hypothetical protein